MRRCHTPPLAHSEPIPEIGDALPGTGDAHLWNPMRSTLLALRPAYSELPDSDLLELTRDGDDRAFGELWNRHSAIGHAIARRVTNRLDPADLVSEAFTRILQAIRNGAGPRTAVRTYLAITIRAVAASWGRKQQVTVELDAVPEAGGHDERLIRIDNLDDLDRATAAFKSLPERWQTALWHSAVEGRSNTEIGEILHLKPTAVAMLTSRARAGLRKAWETGTPGMARTAADACTVRTGAHAEKAA